MPNPIPTTPEPAGRRSATVRVLCCPECGSRRLSTIERLTGAGRCETVSQTSGGTLVFGWTGWTDIDWDSSTTIGLQCDECSYTLRGPVKDLAARFTPGAGRGGPVARATGERPR